MAWGETMWAYEIPGATPVRMDPGEVSVAMVDRVEHLLRCMDHDVMERTWGNKDMEAMVITTALTKNIDLPGAKCRCFTCRQFLNAMEDIMHPSPSFCQKCGGASCPSAS